MTHWVAHSCHRTLFAWKTEKGEDLGWSVFSGSWAGDGPSWQLYVRIVLVENPRGALRPQFGSTTFVLVTFVSVASRRCVPQQHILSGWRRWEGRRWRSYLSYTWVVQTRDTRLRMRCTDNGMRSLRRQWKGGLWHKACPGVDVEAICMIRPSEEKRKLIICLVIESLLITYYGSI